MTTELTITRHFAAPRALVYRAFTDPDQIAEWFGPIGFSVPRDTVSMEVSVGGHQRFTMVADDGSMTSPVNSTFTEVIENELLAGEEKVDGIPGMEGIDTMFVRIELFDDGDGTRLELTQGPYSEDMRGNAAIGWESSFTKLDSLLAT